MKAIFSAGILLLGTLVLTGDLPPLKPIKLRVDVDGHDYVFELSESNIGDSKWDDHADPRLSLKQAIAFARKGLVEIYDIHEERPVDGVKLFRLRPGSESFYYVVHFGQPEKPGVYSEPEIIVLMNGGFLRPARVVPQ